MRRGKVVTDLITYIYPETFKELSQMYKAKASERVHSSKPKKEKEIPQMIMVC